MVWLRHSSRFLHSSVGKYIEDQLAVLGWTVAGSVPFDAPVVTVIEGFPHEWEAVSKLTPGKVAISLGDERDTVEQEMGGPLVLQDIPIFIDCYMDTEAATLALACDVRDICKGRLSGTSQMIPMLDFRVTPTPTVVPGWVVELTDVVRERVDVRPNWQVVKVTASTLFNEVRV